MPLSDSTPRPPLQSVDTATRHAPISQVPVNGKPTPPRTTQRFGQTNLQTPKISADARPALNPSRQAFPSELGIMDPTAVPWSVHEVGSARDEEESDEGEDYEFCYLRRVSTLATRGSAAVMDSGMPKIPDETVRQGSPPLPPIPQSETGGKMVHIFDPFRTLQTCGYEIEDQTPPWRLIHQRLLGWATTWQIPELDAAVGSTTSGCQVDEISLRIWTTQKYKRYVRTQMTKLPQGRVDKLFVPPNVADAISTAVFNRRHEDAHSLLRCLWFPFGLDGIPRQLIVLARHGADENHWVVHRCACSSCTVRLSEF